MLDAQQLAHYEAFGFCWARQRFDGPEIALLVAEAERANAGGEATTVCEAPATAARGPPQLEPPQLGSQACFLRECVWLQAM